MTVEATGETVSEAKWRALQELERLEPTLDRAAVRFQVLEEGHRGLLGVGYTPARVVASAEPGPAAGAAVIDESELAAQLRDLLTHVTAAFGLRCRIDIDESDESLTAVCTAADLGLLIGRRGQTIDAVQLLCYRAAFQGRPDRKRVTVDAAGYRERRRDAVERQADRAAERALKSGNEVELEPMTPTERRVVHQHLKDRAGIETFSEGDEPERCVVVAPLLSD